MDNNKFEEILKKEMKKDMILPSSIQIRINETYRKIEKDRMERDMKRFKIIRRFIEIVTLLFVGGNIVAYAINKPNVISYVIDKLNIGSSYEKYSENINITKKSNGVSITLKDIAIDSKIVAIGYNVKFDEKINEDRITLDVANRIISNGYDYNLVSKDIQNISYKISDNEFEIYNFYKINSDNFNNDVKIISKISDIYPYSYEVAEPVVKGEWNFEHNFKRNEHKLGYKKYNVKNAEITFKEDKNAKVKVKEMEFSEIGTIITFEVPYTSPDLNYTAEIRDSRGNIILEKDAQSSYDKIIAKKLDLKDKITITMYENYNNKVISASTKIDLSKQLESEEKETKKTKYKDIIFGKIKLNIPESWESEDGAENSIIISKKDNYEGAITIYKYNLSGSLEERYEILKTLDKVYYAYQKDGIYNIQPEESEKEYKLTYDEFKKIVDGGKVTKDGYTITQKVFGSNIDGYEVISKENIKIDGTNVIKYICKGTYRDTMINYIIGKNDETYLVSIEQNSENKDIVDNIIKNIKISK